MSSALPALELHDACKRYGSTEALAGVTFHVAPGSLHMLLGENGAGKTTVLNVAAGFTTLDAGVLRVRGVATQWRNPAEARRGGVRAVQQHFSLVPGMTVSENVALAWSGVWSRYSPHVMARRVRDVATGVGLTIDPGARVEDLPVAAQQRVEIVKALAPGAQLLFLDEPTSVLSPSESADLFAWLRRFVARGHSAVVITHRIHEAMRHGDAITVLRNGRTVLTVSHAQVTEGLLLDAILGDHDDQIRLLRTNGGLPVGGGEVVARLTDATVMDARGVPRLRGATLEVRAGEVIGVAGVEGSGVAQLLRALSGRLPLSSGTAELPPAVGFIPEDRLRDGLVGEMSAVENYALRSAGLRRGTLNWSHLRQLTGTMLHSFDVRASGPEQAVATLSGGNQQKFVVARELSGAPPLIVAENPTRGLDVRAAKALLSRLLQARQTGAAIVFHSGDLDELLAIADRVVVCFGGRVRDVSPTFEAVGAAMLGES